MGTGIVSVALELDGQEAVSHVLLVMCAGFWIALGLLLAASLPRHRRQLRAFRRSPAALTAVAGTAVLGTRLTLMAWTAISAVLLGLGAAVWLVLAAPIVRRLQSPTTGSSLLVSVSTTSLAVLAGALAGRGGAGWLVYPGLVLTAIGLGLYGYVMIRFDFGQLVRGHGDHWVTGGAVALLSLALSQITEVARRLGALQGGAGALRTCATAVWTVAMLWLAALVLTEVFAPRLRYDDQRWATVFPLGMYSACSFELATVTGSAPIRDFARVWTWVAFVVWALVLAGMVSSYRVGGRRRPCA